MDTVTSRDGTSIACERTGGGPAVELVGGGLDDGTENAPLAAELADRFTVLNYARRGRGASGDTPPYTIEREVEDLAALLDTVDEPRYLYGTSSGDALVLEAAAAGLTGIAKIAVYEVPYNMSAGWPAQWQAYVEALHAVPVDGEPGAALELFLRLTGASDADVAGSRSSPFWAGGVALEHTLAYDATCLGSGRPAPERLVLTYVVRSEARVDEIMKAANNAGATILQPAATKQWGGYGGSFADPDGYVWDIGYSAQGKNRPYAE